MSAPTELRYKCELQGCFNVKQRLKFKVFKECFGSSGCDFTDIDACTERNGHQLWLEWKTPGKALEAGQSRLFAAHCSGRPHHKVFVVWGDAESMQPEAVQVIDNYGGKPKRDCDFQTLKKMIADWFDRADDINNWIDG